MGKSTRLEKQDRKEMKSVKYRTLTKPPPQMKSKMEAAHMTPHKRKTTTAAPSTSFQDSDSHTDDSDDFSSEEEDVTMISRKADEMISGRTTTAAPPPRQEQPQRAVVVPRVTARQLRKCTAADCTHFVYENENALTSKGLRCSRHRQVQCSVHDCAATAYGKVPRPEDKFGPRGLRCRKHGGGVCCSVPGCINLTGPRRVFVEDQFGGVGWRCELHNGKIPTKEDLERYAPKNTLRQNQNGKFGYYCTAIGCKGGGKKKIPFEDAFGPAGLRCSRHGAGAQCEAFIDNGTRLCSHFPRGRVKDADEFGAADELRCFRHGGRTRCSVNECPDIAVGRADVADKWGRAGTRCEAHGGGANRAGNPNVPPSGFD